MIVRELVISNKSGLHARPAALWVKEAARFQSAIRLKKSEKEVDGKSLLGVLSLGLSTGSAVQLLVSGPDENEAADGMVNFLAGLAKEE